MATHLINRIEDEKTLCGIDTIKVGNSYPVDRLTLIKKFVTCQTCIQKSTGR